MDDGGRRRRPVSAGPIEESLLQVFPVGLIEGVLGLTIAYSSLVNAFELIGKSDIEARQCPRIEFVLDQGDGQENSVTLEERYYAPPFGLL